MSRALLDAAHDKDDPLAGWIRWLSRWPKNLTSSVDLKAAMASILKRFNGQRRYRNDERYLKLWMRYADLTDDPNKVFLLLKTNAIGTQLALFWAAWAYVLELDESYSGAAVVLAEGKARGAEPVSLLEGFQDAFHERMCRKMQMAHTGPEKCAIESTVQVIVSVPTSGLTSSCTSIEFGKPDVFTGTVQSPSSWRGSMRRRSLGSGRDHSQDGKAVDVKICVREEARGSSPEIHLQGGLVQRPGRPECKQELSNEKVETPSTSVDDGGLPCVKIARSTPSGRGDRSTIIALGLRGDLFTQAAATCRLCMLGNNLEKHSGSPDRCECGCTAVAVIQDPFSASKRQLLTLDTALYLDWARSSNVVNDFRPEPLAKRWPRKVAEAKGGTRRRAVLARALGTQLFDVLSVLGEGASAVVFSCQTHEDKRAVAVKIEHQVTAPSIPWECFTMLQLRERLLHRRQCDGTNSRQPLAVVVKPESLFLYRDACAMTMPQGRFGTLHGLVSLYAKKAQAVPQLIAMHYALEMLRFCRAMHSVSILHMDIKPDNWLLTSRPTDETRHAEGGGQPGISAQSLSLIDFGRAIDLSIFPDNGLGVAFSGKCCASSFSCPAMTEERVWKHDADLFALGSCIYFMLHGDYLEISCEGQVGSASASPGHRWRPAKRCKRYWCSDVWDRLLDELLNFDYRSTDTGSTEEVLGQLEALLCSYMSDLHRPYELQECLRKQENMFFNR